MENSQTRRSRIGLDSLAYIVIILAGVKVSTPIVVPFLLSLFIVIIFKPFADALQKKGIPGWLAFTIILAIILLFGFLLVAIISASVQDFTQNLSVYDKKLSVYQNQITILFNKLGVADKQQLEALLDRTIYKGLKYLF